MNTKLYIFRYEKTFNYSYAVSPIEDTYLIKKYFNVALPHVQFTSRSDYFTNVSILSSKGCIDEFKKASIKTYNFFKYFNIPYKLIKADTYNPVFREVYDFAHSTLYKIKLLELKGILSNITDNEESTGI